MVGRTAYQVEVLPVIELRPHVNSYVGFELSGFPAGVHLGTPGRALNLIISLADPVDIAEVGGAAPRAGRFEAVVSGLMSKSIAIQHNGSQHGVRVSLTPLGARTILGMPAGALAHDFAPLADVVGPLGTELVDRLRSGTCWAERFSVLDAVLVHSLRRRPGHRSSAVQLRPEVGEAWRRLVAARGQIRVGALATDLGWSRRHLSDRFRSEIGVTPKQMARILRFEHAYQLATAPVPSSWIDVSTTAGYADQAHLVREWREFTGCAPTVWRRTEVLPSLA